MWSVDGPLGPWHDMATGPIDHCWEIVDALTFLEEEKQNNRRKEVERIRQQIAEKFKENPRQEMQQDD